MYDKNTLIGKCHNCDCGNRPGPWHQKSCPAYMKTENFNETKEKQNEIKSTKR